MGSLLVGKVEFRPLIVSEVTTQCIDDAESPGTSLKSTDKRPHHALHPLQHHSAAAVDRSHVAKFQSQPYCRESRKFYEAVVPRCTFTPAHPSVQPLAELSERSVLTFISTCGDTDCSTTIDWLTTLSTPPHRFVCCRQGAVFPKVACNNSW